MALGRTPLLVPLDAKPQEVEALVDVGDLRLGRGKPQPHPTEHLCRLLPQPLRVGAGTSNHRQPIIRIADQAVVGQAPMSTRLPAVGGAHRSPRLGEMIVEDAERDVAEQR